MVHGVGSSTRRDVPRRRLRHDGRGDPDVFTAAFEYPKFLATWTLDYTNTMDNGWNIQFLGGRPPSGSTTRARALRLKGHRHDLQQVREAASDRGVPGSLSDEHHVRNFLECVKSRKEPDAPVEVGHLAVSGPHLANVAWHHEGGPGSTRMQPACTYRAAGGRERHGTCAGLPFVR